MRLDPKGYFLIRINRGKNLIEVGFCKYKDKKVIETWEGKNPDALFGGINNKYISLESHKHYLEKEFAKARKCLDDGSEYVQE
ncbi:MAG: hypothetical protein U9O49_04380 [Candidatus Thermoplasmatota archaeon]|nr:hypothetical protein [Candidatus Thermoplasmatota archaeon]